MGLGEAAIIGGATLGSAALGYFGQKSTQRKNERNIDKSYKLEREKFQLYKKLSGRQQKELDLETDERRALAERKYEAMMRDWTLKTGALDKMIDEWKTWELDPRKAPAFVGLRDAMMAESRKMMKGLSGQMERAGRTGGAQDRMRQDVTRGLQSKLATEMLQIQRGARMKQLELEMGRPSEPWLEWYGYPRVGQPVSQYQGTFSAEPLEGFRPDMTGLGMMAAMMMAGGGKGADVDVSVSNEAWQAPSLQTLYPGQFEDWTQSVAFQPGMNTPWGGR